MDFLEKRLFDVFPTSEWSRRRVCIAASGGPDSVALTRAFHAIAQKENLLQNLLVVTVDHQLRGAESDGDAQFVCSLCESLGIGVQVKRVDKTQLEEETRRAGSLENAARTLRYQLLRDAAHEFGARFLLTAHHQGDQLETILFRLFRGSGLDGLKGISSSRPLDESLVLLRPMLTVTKQEILNYLKRLGQDYRVDSSNQSSEFDRNRIRNELVPLLNELFPNRWQNALTRLAEQSAETSAYFDWQLDELETKLKEEKKRAEKYRQTLQSLQAVPSPCSENDANRVVVSLLPLQNLSSEIVRRFYRRIWTRMGWPLGSMGHEEWNRLVEATQKRKSPRQFPGNIAATFNQDDTLTLERLAKAEPTSKDGD